MCVCFTEKKQISECLSGFNENLFVVTTGDRKVLFYSVSFKQKIEKSTFPPVNVAAKYAKIDKVGSLDASFPQVPLFFKVSNIFIML